MKLKDKRVKVQDLVWKVEEAGLGMLKSGFSDTVMVKDIDVTIVKLEQVVKILKELGVVDE